MLRYSTATAFAALVGAGVLAPVSAVAQESVARPDARTDLPVVAVAGVGEVTLPPDMATIAITIRTIDPEADVASRRNVEVAGAVAEAIEASGVASDSLRLTGLRIRPNREYTSDGLRDAGFYAQRSLRVTTNDPTAVATIVDVALDAGATSIDRVSYSSSEEKSARRRALVQAVEEAREEAEVVAAAAGGSLGRMLRISTQEAGSRPITRGFSTGGRVIRGAAPNPEPEHLAVSARVLVEWELDGVESP